MVPSALRRRGSRERVVLAGAAAPAVGVAAGVAVGLLGGGVVAVLTAAVTATVLAGVGVTLADGVDDPWWRVRLVGAYMFGFAALEWTVALFAYVLLATPGD
jgi:hypothetical protein